MTAAELAHKCVELQKAAEQERSKRDQAKGALEQLRRELKEKFGCHEEGAKRKLKELEKAEQKAQEEALEAWEAYQKEVAK